MVADLKLDPGTTRLLVEDGTFPSIKRAHRTLERMRKRGELYRFRSMVEDGDTRYNLYFAGPRFGENMTQHHYEVTKILWMIDGYEHLRWNLAHDVDAHLFSKYRALYLENDKDTENHRRVRARVGKLKDAALPILWVAPSMRRVRELKKLTEPIKRNCLYGVYEKVISDPHAAGVWERHDGSPFLLRRGEEA